MFIDITKKEIELRRSDMEIKCFMTIDTTTSPLQPSSIIQRKSIVVKLYAYKNFRIQVQEQ